MTEEKLRKVVTALTVAATTLFVILLGVLVYQAITISVLKNKEEKLIKETSKLEEIIEEGKLDAEYYESEIGKDWLAFQLGFINTGDN